METVELSQNTLEWEEERRRFIGSSDVPIIMGYHNWSTPYKLWEQKLGFSEENTADKQFIFQKGHRLEDKARKMYELYSGLDFPPKVVQKSDLPYARASLDGINFAHKKQIEIKYVGRGVWLDLKNGANIPDHYYPQVQYQLMITGFASCDFVTVTDEKLKKESEKNPAFSGFTVTNVELDIDYVKEMIKKCNAFYKCMLNKTPPPLTDKDYKKITDIPTVNLINKYRDLYRQKKELEGEINEVKDLLGKSMKHNRMIYGGNKLSKILKAGSVDYKKIPELKSVNLDLYRKEPIEVFRIDLEKESK